MNSHSDQTPPLSFDFLPEIEGSSSKALLKYCEINPGLSWEFCQELFTEFYKFFSVYGAKLNGQVPLKSNLLLPPVEIAKIWEFHVQNTAKYPLLCEKIGQKYVHYHPEIYNFEDEAAERGLKELYEDTVSRMKASFGALNNKIWGSFDEVKKGYQNSFNVSLKRLRQLVQEDSPLLLKISDIMKKASDVANYAVPSLPVLESSQVPTEALEKIEKIVLPKDFLEILCRKLLITPETAIDLLVEYKKFLLMSLISQIPIAPSGFVDEVWHLHMLFTREYIETCKNLKGNVIIHVPLIDNSIAEKENLQGFYKKTIELYEKTFGKRVENFWPEHGDQGEEAKLEHTFIWINTEDKTLNLKDLVDKKVSNCYIYCARKNEDELIKNCLEKYAGI